MEQIISLDKLPVKCRAVIDSVADDGDLSERLKELGFVKNTIVRTVHRSRDGEVAAYEIMGAVFAVRKRDSVNIAVKMTEDSKQSEVLQWARFLKTSSI